MGAVTGATVSWLNHVMHRAFEEDPPGKKKKSIVNKLKDNPDKILDAANATVAAKQIRMIELRRILSVNDKIGSYRKFAAKYSKIVKVGKVLGYASNAASVLSSGKDIYDYSTGEISSARLTYKLSTTVASAGAGALAGTEFGGPIGTAVGFLGGLTSTAGEMIYDSWNNTILPVISSASYQINNNHAYSNFHP